MKISSQVSRPRAHRYIMRLQQLSLNGPPVEHIPPVTGRNLSSRDHKTVTVKYTVTI